MPERSASFYLSSMELKNHPEGGWYRETYRSDGTIGECCLPHCFEGRRNLATAIYYLLEYPQKSRFHRIKSDEIWHLYDGGPLQICEIDQAGSLIDWRLGRDVQNGEQPQIVVRAGSWFAAQLLKPQDYALVGCTVSPGFDFHDFEMADTENLLTQYPQHAAAILSIAKG